MKNLLLFVSFALFATILNGQKITVMNDLDPENTSLNIEFRHSFDGGILFDVRKIFETYYVSCTSDGTVENTAETTINPIENSNAELYGNFDIGDGFVYYFLRSNNGQKIYRLSKQTLEFEFFQNIELPSNEFINDIDYYKNYFYYTVDSDLYRISLITREVELIADLGFYDAKGVKVFKDKIYLLADNEDGYYGLFECTGTAASIKLIRKLKSFDGISDQKIHWFEFKDKLYFTLYFRTDEPGTIYYTDGSENGTGSLIDIHHDSFFDFYNVFKVGDIGDKFIFFEYVPNGGLGDARIYASDGTSQGTTELLPGTVLKRRSKNIEVVNNECYFLSDNKLYKTDGTQSGTTTVLAEYTSEFNFLGESLFFTTEDRLINRMDKNGNTSLVKYNGSNLRTYDELFKSGSKLYFSSSVAGDTRLISLEDSITSSTKFHNLNKISLNPNIISQHLTIDRSLVGSDLLVYDFRGVIVLQLSNISSSVDCSTLAAGAYYVKFIDRNKNLSHISNFTKL